MNGVLETIRNSGGVQKRFLITTSPVPLGRTFTTQDALVANCHSKSLLRAVAQELAFSAADVDYFPSYESVVMTRSDLAWVDDLRHVRDDLVGRIIERVTRAYFVDIAPDEGPLAKYLTARRLASAGELDRSFELYSECARRPGQQPAIPRRFRTALQADEEISRRAGQHHRRVGLRPSQCAIPCIRSGDGTEGGRTRPVGRSRQNGAQAGFEASCSTRILLAHVLQRLGKEGEAKDVVKEALAAVAARANRNGP